MSELRPVNDVIFDVSIYPRAQWNARTVERYAEAIQAGETLPPIILEAGTGRLLDGVHRWKAHQQVGADTIEVEEHEVPAGVPAKLYAASLSARHGDRMTGDELRSVAREVVSANPDYSQSAVARLLGVTRQTVGRYCGDISERRRQVRAVRAVLLSRAGWSTRDIADFLGCGKSQVSDDVNSDISGQLADDLLTEATESLPCDDVDLLEVIEEVREELVFGRWPEEERVLLKRLQAGETVVVNQHRHSNLIDWAKSAGLYVAVDRHSPWGNPFVLPDDGDRAQVIANYEQHYLPHKPSLFRRLPELQGKALGCWCAPEPCHGDVLVKEAWT